MFDENSIVNRILTGDDTAIERLIDLYEPQVYRYALRYLGKQEEAEQAVIETMHQVFRKLGAKTDGVLSVWVFRITANVCADIQRRKRAGKSTMAVFRLREIHRGEKDEKRDLDEAVQSQLLRLTRQQREVILLRDLCGLDDAATGEVLGMDAGGVRLRISRARKNLRDLLLRQGVLSQPKGKGTGSRCQEFRELCSQYVDECIAEEDKAALLDHIQECPQCAAYLNDLTIIGRSLSHMQEENPPKELRETLVAHAWQQTQEMKYTHRRSRWVPTMILVLIAVVFTVLTCSGALSGLYVNSITDPEIEAPAVPQRPSSVMTEDIQIPDVVSANSYAFVIAAEGETVLPELSASAILLAAEDDVEYYAVNNDFSMVQKLTQGMESMGYELETVKNAQLIIASTAQEGLFIVIHRTE